MPVWESRVSLFRFAAAGIMSMLVALALFNVAQAATKSDKPLYRFAPVPHWVNRVVAEYDAPLPADGVSDGTWDLLLDRQIDVTADGDDYYQHSALKLINANGVDQRSQFDISVDPTFQTLSLNSIRVVRQGRVIDQQPVARITALPQETELRKRIYNGTYNINILLFDVRMGDVIDYEYTIHSTERFFPGQFSERLVTGWSVPMRWERLRMLAPANLSLSYRVDDHSAPTSGVHGGVQEVKWEWRNIAAIQGDDHRPRWYSPWPHFEASSAKDWAEVARRVMPLFQVGDPHSPALLAVVKDIRDAGGTPAEQALRALQFVQEQIRYVSISIGAGAFRPTAPEQVLKQRFGDCKDKSLLLVAILHELGIEAHPALVNSRRGRELDSFLPTPYAFDHAIVRMRMGNESYWLDGTRDKQYSPVTTNTVGDFERALVLDTGTTGLVVIPRPRPDTVSKRSAVQIDLRAGIDKPAKLQISTFYEGRLADSQRQELADESSAERQSSYLKYIVGYYPRARVAAPITVHDDQAKNVVEVREYYDLDRPFTKSDSGDLELFVQADEIYRYLDSLKVDMRKEPLAIDYPVRLQQSVRALLPWSLPIKNETVRIENPAFRYQDTTNYSEEGGVSQLTLDYRYESLADFVDVAALTKYADDRRRAYDDTGYYIRPGARPRTETFVKAAPLRPLAAAPRWVALISLIFAAWIAVRFIFRWDPPARKSEVDWPVGIRGWLFLPAIAVFLSPLTSFESLHNAARYLENDRWQRLHNIAPEPLKAWAPAILLVLTACGVCLLAAEALLIYLFFTRRSSAPYAFIVIHWIGAFYFAALLLVPIAANLSGPLDNAGLITELTGGVIETAIYTAYLLLSKRVKATFVVRLGPQRPGPAPALTWSS
jgi:transglutaminase-like putative cysteine protease